MGAYDLAQNATIASIVGGSGGAGALALLAYNQVQTKNPIITCYCIIPQQILHHLIVHINYANHIHYL